MEVFVRLSFPPFPDLPSDSEGDEFRVIFFNQEIPYSVVAVSQLL